MADNDKPHEDPGRAFAIEGEVVQLGPDGVAVSMTPAAAVGTADALTAAADAAGETSNSEDAEDTNQPGGSAPAST